jgi:DNA/RNA non-specific endonuclease
VIGPSTNRTPSLYPGLHTAPEQSPYYANALAYGREQGYSDDEVMKLTVLMQSNRDQNMGREWLALKPAVLRAAVNAVVRNPDNSFDTSGVFGGQRGYHNAVFASQSIPPQGGTAVDENPVPFDSLVPPDGWVLEERDTGGGDAGPNIIRYYRPSDELIAKNDIPYMPMLMSGYVQVPRGLDSELSVGADGGVHDLSRLDFHPDYGLVTSPDNIRPLDNEDGLDQIVVTAILTVATYGAFTAAASPIVATGTATTGTAGFSTAGMLGGASTLSAAEALALSSFIATTGVTGDVRQGFIAGLASFAGSAVADFVIGSSGLNLPPPTAGNPFTVTNFIRSMVSGTVSGAINGDWRRGFVSGLVSFAANVISTELRLPQSVVSAALRCLYDPKGALNSLISDLMMDTALNGFATGQANAQRRLDAINQLTSVSGMTTEDATTFVDRLIEQGRTMQNATGAQAPSPLLQRVQSEIDDAALRFRVAVDDEDWGTQRDSINRLLTASRQLNPSQSNEDALSGVLRFLGTDKLPSALAFEANGRVTVDRLVLPGNGGTADQIADTQWTAHQQYLRNRQEGINSLVEQLREKNPGLGLSDEQLISSATRIYDERVRQDSVMGVLNLDAPQYLRLSTGSELADQLIGGGVSGINSAGLMLKGVYDFADLSLDSCLALANHAIGEEVFADSARRAEAVGNAGRLLFENIQNMPQQLIDHANRELQRANEFEALGDNVSAARIRADLLGGYAREVLQPGRGRASAVSRVTAFERASIEIGSSLRKPVPAEWIARIEREAAARGLEVVRETRGGRGAWNDALNGNVKPNTVYLLDNGHAYVTDAAGRVTRAEGVLDIARMDRNTYQQIMVGQFGGPGFDGGHLIGSLFGGAGERLNIVAQLSGVNRGIFRTMELEWANAIRAGREVRVEVSPVYSGASKVPTSIDVIYWIDGARAARNFPNTKGS